MTNKQLPINDLAKIVLACINEFDFQISAFSYCKDDVAKLIYNVLDICKDRNEDDIDVIISTISETFDLDKENFPLYSVEK